MNYCEIKCELCKCGYTLTRVARELGQAGPQAVQQVCIGKHRSARTEKFISEITGIPLAKLFPEYYRTPTGRSVNSNKIKKDKNGFSLVDLFILLLILGLLATLAVPRYSSFKNTHTGEHEKKLITPRENVNGPNVLMRLRRLTWTGLCFVPMRDSAQSCAHTTRNAIDFDIGTLQAGLRNAKTTTPE